MPVILRDKATLLRLKHATNWSDEFIIELDRQIGAEKIELHFDSLIALKGTYTASEVDKVLKGLVPEDVVNHPSHYTSGKIEVIAYIEDQKLPYHLGNVVKYISRAGKKDATKTIQDLEKAAWYLNRYIEMLKQI